MPKQKRVRWQDLKLQAVSDLAGKNGPVFGPSPKVFLGGQPIHPAPDSWEPVFFDALLQFRRDGWLEGYWFAEPLPGQEEWEQREWGPEKNEVDWTGFKEAAELAHRR